MNFCIDSLRQTKKFDYKASCVSHISRILKIILSIPSLFSSINAQYMLFGQSICVEYKRVCTHSVRLTSLNLEKSTAWCPSHMFFIPLRVKYSQILQTLQKEGFFCAFCIIQGFLHHNYQIECIWIWNWIIFGNRNILITNVILMHIIDTNNFMLY